MTAGEFVYLITADKSGLQGALNSAEKDAKGWGDKLSAWTIAKGKMIAKSVEKAVSSTVDVVKNVTREAISAYAEFEQLEGGTELLYGEASEKVMKRASEAYKNVQMSQNDYLKQANSFATGLKTSLGGDADAAADLADSIITAQADVVAATGASQDSVANAFTGIMKGNYTMLDNLQLGITPTKQGMQDLIKKVNDWNKANGKATKYNIKNLADQQKALVDYIEMQGLAGYAGKEAADTIEGTMASTKAAWQNLLIAFGSGKGVKEATKNLANSFKQLAKNMIPVMKNVFKGVGEFAKEAIPQISEWINKGIQKLKDSDNPFLQGLAKGLENIKTLASVVVDVFQGDIPSAIEKLQESDSQVLKLVGDALEALQPYISAIETAFTKGIPEAIKELNDSDDPLANLVGGGLQLLYNVCQFFVEHVGLKGTIEGIAGGFLLFKGVSIATSFLNFLDKLKGLKPGNLQALKDLFSTEWKFPDSTGGNLPKGGSPTGGNPAVAPTGKSGGGFWSKTKEALGTAGTFFSTKVAPFLGNVAGTLAPAAALALGVDQFVRNQQWVNDSLARGEQSKAEYAGKTEQYQGKEMYDTWKTLTDYLTINGEGTGADTDTAQQFAKDYMQWLGDSSENPVFDKMSEMMDWDDWERFNTSMADLAEGVPHYSNEEIDEFLNPIQMMIDKIEEAMGGDNKPDSEPSPEGEKADKDLTDRVKKFGKDLEEQGDHVHRAYDGVDKSVTDGGEVVHTALDKTGQGVSDGGTSVFQAITDLAQKIASVKIPGVVGGGGGGGFFDNLLGSLFPGHAKGLYDVPYDDYVARLHKDEMVLTKSQARRYKEGDSSGVNLKALERGIVASVREGMNDAQVNSYMDGKAVTGGVNSRTSRAMKARRFAPAW